MKNKGIFCAFIAVALCSLVGCNQKKTAKKEKTESTSVVHEDDDSKIRQIFSMYRESGGTLSYEEWLRTIKGEKGDPGQNGEDGNDGSTINTSAINKVVEIAGDKLVFKDSDGKNIGVQLEDFNGQPSKPSNTYVRGNHQ